MRTTIPKGGESVVLAFRMEGAQDQRFVAKLEFARAAGNYELLDADSDRRWEMSGDELVKSGFAIVLEKPRMSALIRIRRRQTEESMSITGK